MHLHACVVIWRMQSHSAVRGRPPRLRSARMRAASNLADPRLRSGSIEQRTIVAAFSGQGARLTQDFRPPVEPDEAFLRLGSIGEQAAAVRGGPDFDSLGALVDRQQEY